MNQSKLPVRQKPIARDISESLGKLPPQAPELEESVLGAIMLEKNAIVEVASILRPEHFYLDQHKEIYIAIQQLFAEGNPIDMRTVVNQLRKTGKLEFVGNASYIVELTSKISSAANIEYHTRLILEMSMKRSLINMASQIHHDAYEDTSDVFNVLERTNLELQEIHDNAIGTRPEKILKEVCFNVIKEVQSRMAGVASGLKSRFEVVDRLLNGLKKAALLIIAARPGMGKTALAMQIGKQVAEQGEPVGIFSLEMSANELVERLACAEAEIDSDKVQKGKDHITTYEFERFINSTGKIGMLPMFIDDTPFMTIVELRARAMRMKTKYKIKLLIVDYLQLIKGLHEKGQQFNRDQEIGLITRTLKGIAKELDIPVIALSQLSRAVEQRGGAKRPQLSDLRESGNIEQDADVVMFLYRPEYYKITESDDGTSTHGLSEVIVDKHRGGALGTVLLKFIGKYTKFGPWVTEYSTPTSTDRQRFGTSHYKDPTQELPKDLSDQPF